MSLLLEHGPLLPEIFRDVLSALYEGSRSQEDVQKIIRSRVEFREALILEHWGSWEAFAADIIGALENEGYLTHHDGELTVTARAVPGKQLEALRLTRLGRRIRFTFHAREPEQAREALAQARIRAGEFASFLSAHSAQHPVIRQAHEDAVRIMQLLSWALNDPGMSVRGSKGAVRAIVGGQSDWYRDWVRTAGWHSTDGARLAWNDSHPAKPVTRASECGFRSAQRQMLADGLMERRSSVRKDGKSGGWEYRWRQG